MVKYSRFYLYFLRFRRATPMREFLNPQCRFCRIARITGLSVGLLAVLLLLAAFIIAH